MSSTEDRIKVIHIELVLTSFSGFFDNEHTEQREYWLRGECKAILHKKHTGVGRTWLDKPIVDHKPVENMLCVIAVVNEITIRDKK